MIDAPDPPPFEGETIADVLARSDSLPERPYHWLELVAHKLWAESPHRHAFDRVDNQVFDLLDRGVPVSTALLGSLLDRYSDVEVAAVAYAVRLGYALGKHAHLPEPERLARARALAGLHAVPDPGDLLSLDEWEAVRRPAPKTPAAPATTTAPNEEDAR